MRPYYDDGTYCRADLLSYGRGGALTPLALARALLPELLAEGAVTFDTASGVYRRGQ